MASISPAVFTLLLCLLHVSSLVYGRPVPADSKMSLDDRGHFMLHKKSMDYNPVDGGNAVSIAGSRSYIPGGDDTLAESKMSLDGRGHFMHPEKSLDIVGGNAVSRRYIPSGDDMLAARWSESLPPPSVVIESEPPSKPSPPTCLPRC